MALVIIYAVLSHFDFVAKFTVKNLNKDFTNTGRGGGATILWKFFIKPYYFLKYGFPNQLTVGSSSWTVTMVFVIKIAINIIIKIVINIAIKIAIVTIAVALTNRELALAEQWRRRYSLASTLLKPDKCGNLTKWFSCKKILQNSFSYNYVNTIFWQNYLSCFVNSSVGLWGELAFVLTPLSIRLWC